MLDGRTLAPHSPNVEPKTLLRSQGAQLSDPGWSRDWSRLAALLTLEITTPGPMSAPLKFLQALLFVGQGVLVAEMSGNPAAPRFQRRTRWAAQSAVVPQLALITLHGLWAVLTHDRVFEQVPIVTANRLGGMITGIVIVSYSAEFDGLYAGRKRTLLLAALAVGGLVLYLALFFVLFAAAIAVGMSAFRVGASLNPDAQANCRKHSSFELGLAPSFRVIPTCSTPLPHL